MLQASYSAHRSKELFSLRVGFLQSKNGESGRSDRCQYDPWEDAELVRPGPYSPTMDKHKSHGLLLIYPNQSDKVAETLKDKEGVYAFGRLTKRQVYLPPRIINMGLGLTLAKDSLGKVTGDGFHQTMSGDEIAALFYKVLSILPKEKVPFLSSLDLGSGLMGPSLQMAQYLCQGGTHFGIELQRGVHIQARLNIKHITEKGMKNIREGFLSRPSVDKSGELDHVVPPNCVACHGNIFDIQEVGCFDFMYAFDCVALAFVSTGYTSSYGVIIIGLNSISARPACAAGMITGTVFALPVGVLAFAALVDTSPFAFS